MSTEFIFLIHKAPTKNRGKLLNSIGVTKKQSKKNQNRINDVKILKINAVIRTTRT